MTTRTMTVPKVFEELASIVLVGNLNPTIFQPAWLASKGLIRESEASEATIELIHPDIAQYRAGWLHLSVTRDRFSASTSDPAFHGPLRDVVVGVFSLLEQTPTSRLGLNRAMHVDLLDDERWNALGHLVAPKQPWNDIVEKPGTRMLLIEGHRRDAVPGRAYFRVEPSQKYPHAAFLDVNSEYHPDPKLTPSEQTAYFVSRIRSDWERAMSEASTSIDKLVQQGLEGEAVMVAQVSHLTLAEDGSADLFSLANKKLLTRKTPDSLVPPMHTLSSRLSSHPPNVLVTQPTREKSYLAPSTATEVAHRAADAPMMLDTQGEPPVRVVRLPDATQLDYRFDLRQQWEGVVTGVATDEFTVTLRDVINPALPEYDAVIPKEEVSEDDLSLLREGAVLYWTIGYKQSRTGTRERISTIRLRRLPAWTRADVTRVANEAHEYDELFKAD